jgi:hypothetical protein
MSLSLAIANAKTSNGDKWWLNVIWVDSPGANMAIADIDLEHLTTEGPTGFESHLWSFQVHQSTLTFNGKSGTLDLGKEASPVATLDLAFKTTSSKPGKCTSGKATIYSGTLNGKASLVTGLKGGGTISGNFDFNVNTPQIVVDDGCVPPISGNTCSGSALIASSSTSGAGETEVLALTESGAGGEQSLVALLRETALTSPKLAFRSDEVARDDNGDTVFARYADSEVKLGSSGGLISGSATIIGKAQTENSPCTYKGTKYEVTSHRDETAIYSGTFTSTPVIGNPLTGPKSSKDASYLDETSKKI